MLRTLPLPVSRPLIQECLPHPCPLLLFLQIATKRDLLDLKGELSEKVFNSTMRFGKHMSRAMGEPRQPHVLELTRLALAVLVYAPMCQTLPRDIAER